MAYKIKMKIFLTNGIDESCVYKVILKNKAQLRSSSHDQGWVEFLMTQFINPISSLKEEARA